jgi:hypothetical protein
MKSLNMQQYSAKIAGVNRNMLQTSATALTIMLITPLLTKYYAISKPQNEAKLICQALKQE